MKLNKSIPDQIVVNELPLVRDVLNEGLVVLLEMQAVEFDWGRREYVFNL